MKKDNIFECIMLMNPTYELLYYIDPMLTISSICDSMYRDSYCSLFCISLIVAGLHDPKHYKILLSSCLVVTRILICQHFKAILSPEELPSLDYMSE